MKVEKTVELRDAFVVTALRNCGYNNYTAIADIIDNSIEPEVGSEFVKIMLGHEGKEVNSIQVMDNGCGMSMDSLHEAMALGSQTGKTGVNNLGMYGAGLKTASLSMGQEFEVVTKTADSNKVNVATFSVVDAVRGQGPVKVTFEERDAATMEEFCKMVGGHGTLVTITKLDKLTNKDYNNFRGCLKRRIAEMFNKFILGKVAKIYVENEEVPYIDLMGTNNLVAEGEFAVEGRAIQYKVWNLPKVGGFDDFSDTDDETVSTVNGDTIGRTFRNQGLFIYRQNRLVGRALTLGLWVRHPAGNGFRCEIFVDGTCDYMFGSTFTKSVNEQSKEFLNQEFLDQLTKTVSPIYRQIVKQEKKKAAEEKANDPEAQAKNEQFYKRVTEKQNKNMMLAANRSGVNKPQSETKEHKHRGPQQNPNPTRERKNKWLDGFREESLGYAAEMFSMDFSGNKKTIVVNTDHPFYTQLYSKLDDDLKFNMAMSISCIEIAKQNLNYYGSVEIADIIDNFMEFLSREVGKSFRF